MGQKQPCNAPMPPLRCVVTGASGFLGAALVEGLVQRGHSVLAVVRPESDRARLANVESKIEFAYASLHNLLTIEAHVAAFAPDVVFHLAWWGGNSKKFVNQADQMLINIPGSMNVVHLARQAHANTFVFYGSGIEYGKYNIPVRETDSAEPTNLYGASKLATMQMAETLCRLSGIRFCSVRPFWTYGPRDDANRMIPALIEKLLDRQRPAITAGKQLWDFLYIDDATEAVIRLAQTSSASGVFNMASGLAVPLGQVAECIRDLIDPGLELGLGDVPYASDQIMHLQGDISRLKHVTGWQPVVGLDDGLRRTVAWHQSKRAAAKV
jgi:UDP-glucose 4-epimerase